MLNTVLMKHPINWLIVLLMLVIAGLFGHYLLMLFDQSPATKNLVSANLSSEQLSNEQQKHLPELQDEVTE